MAKIQNKRGLKTNLPTLADGELAYCHDTNEIFIGTSSGNKLLVKARPMTSTSAPVLEQEQIGIFQSKLYVGISGSNIEIVAIYASTAAAADITSGTASQGTSKQYARQDHNHKITLSAVTGALTFTPENPINKGAANGYAGLGSDGKVPASQLPSFVDDVIDLLSMVATAPSTCAIGDKYYNTTSKKIFTATAANTWGTTGVDPESGKIYVVLSDNKTYRWSGTTMAEISASLVIGTGANNAAAGNHTHTGVYASNSHVSQVATASELGHIKIGFTQASKNYPVLLNASNQAYVTVPWTDTTYTHPTTAGNKHIPAGGAEGNILIWSAAGTAVWTDTLDAGVF